MRAKLWKWLLVLYVFLLPWQTRWIYGPRFLNGGFWEYGTSSWYATEILLWSAVLIFVSQNIFCVNYKHLFSKTHFEVNKKKLFLALGLILLALIQVLTSLNPGVSYDRIFLIIEGLCLFTLLSFDTKKLKYFYALWLAGVGQGLFAALQFLQQEIFANKWLGLAAHSPATLGTFVVEAGGERWLRAYGSFGSPNILGGFLAVTFILGLILYLQSKPATKIILTLGQAFVLLGLLLSFSRSAWLATMLGWVALGCIILFKPKEKSEKFFTRFHERGLYLKQSIFALAVVFALVSNLPQLFNGRISSSSRLEVKSLSERVSQNMEAFEMIKRDPFFGVGPGVYTLSTFQKDPTHESYYYQPVHNSFLLAIAEYGIIGFLVIALVGGYFVITSFRRNILFMPLIFVVIVSASFDHFWLSLPIGASLGWLVYTFVFSFDT